MFDTMERLQRVFCKRQMRQLLYLRSSHGAMRQHDQYRLGRCTMAHAPCATGGAYGFCPLCAVMKQQSDRGVNWAQVSSEQKTPKWGDVAVIEAWRVMRGICGSAQPSKIQPTTRPGIQRLQVIAKARAALGLLGSLHCCKDHVLKAKGSLGAEYSWPKPFCTVLQLKPADDWHQASWQD